MRPAQTADRPGDISSPGLHGGSPVPTIGMAWVPGGRFSMGSNAFYPEESPAHDVSLDGFWIDIHATTNDQFAAFVEETGYLTAAERPPSPDNYPGVAVDDLVPGSAVFDQPPGPVFPMSPASWWRYCPGSCWNRPNGPGSTLEGLEHHPVVHVAHEDAVAYARWASKDLPTEAQWERAARGGLHGRAFAWEDDGRPPHEHANTWHGTFPHENLKRQRPGTEQVGSYPPNGFGLFDMIGNVWEWTQDLFAPGHGNTSPHGGCCGAHNPTGPVHALSEPDAPSIPLYVLKGGSFLCAENYCSRYRPSARIPQAADSATSHTGFRCIRADLDQHGHPRPRADQERLHV